MNKAAIAYHNFVNNPTCANGVQLEMETFPLQCLLEGTNASYKALERALSDSLDTSTREQVHMMLSAFDAKYNPQGVDNFVPRMSEDFVREAIAMAVFGEGADTWQEMHLRNACEMASTFLLSGQELDLYKAMQLFKEILKATGVYSSDLSSSKA